MLLLLLLQVMKTYHMYHTESLSAESKLKEAEKQEEKHIGKANDIGSALLRYGHDERPQRRSSVKKMEKLKEKVSRLSSCVSLASSAVSLQSVRHDSGRLWVPSSCSALGL